MPLTARITVITNHIFTGTPIRPHCLVVFVVVMSLPGAVVLNNLTRAASRPVDQSILHSEELCISEGTGLQQGKQPLHGSVSTGAHHQDYHQDLHNTRLATVTHQDQLDTFTLSQH